MNKPDISLRSAWFEPCIHSAYFQILGRLVASRRLGVARAFSGQPRLLPLLDFLPMLDLVQAVERPESGFDVGRTITGAAHGPMGLAAMSSASLEEALRTIERYTPIRNRMFSYRVERADGRIALVIKPRMPLGGYERFMHGATLCAIFNIFRSVLDEAALGQAVLNLPWPAGAHMPPSAPGQVWQERYGAAEMSIAFPAELAGLAFESADADVHERVRQAGEEELKKLDGSVAAKVRHFIHRQQPSWPTLVEAAELLGVSRRTLVRRLEDEGVSFQDLLDESRNELACWYLRHSALPLGDISEQLGFGDQANFSRAFRRWQGLSAREYRACFNEAARAFPAAPSA